MALKKHRQFLVSMLLVVSITERMTIVYPHKILIYKYKKLALALHIECKIGNAFFKKKIVRCCPLSTDLHPSRDHKTNKPHENEGAKKLPRLQA